MNFTQFPVRIILVNRNVWFKQADKPYYNLEKVITITSVLPVNVCALNISDYSLGNHIASWCMFTMTERALNHIYFEF